MHFGLGDATAADVTVLWPDGTRSDWTGLAADGFYVLERDKPVAPFTPRD